MKMTRRLGEAGLLLALAWAGPGCARDLARASSGAIGCAPDEIEIDDVSVGWAETSWAASCRGASFRCAGEHAPSCTPSLVAPEADATDEPPDDAQTYEPTRARPATSQEDRHPTKAPEAPSSSSEPSSPAEPSPPADPSPDATHATHATVVAPAPEDAHAPP